MQHSAIIVALFFLSINSAFALTNSPNANNKVAAAGGITAAENTALEFAQNAYDAEKSKLPEWLQRIDFNVTLAQHAKPIWYVRTIQPLYQKPLNVVFVQGQLSSQGSSTTSNIGIGYRHLLSNKTWILGINSFFDREWHYGHERIGAGLEAIGQYATFRANYYDAITGKEKIKTSDGVTTWQQALNGYDVSAEMPVPYLPWAAIEYTRYFWWRHDGASNIRGYQFSLHMNPTGSIETEVGVSNDNASEQSYYVSLDWHFGRPARIEYALSTNPYNNHFFIKRNLSLHMLDYVQRENQIIVQTTKTGSGGVIISRGD